MKPTITVTGVPGSNRKTAAVSVAVPTGLSDDEDIDGDELQFNDNQINRDHDGLRRGGNQRDNLKSVGGGYNAYDDVNESSMLGSPKNNFLKAASDSRRQWAQLIEANLHLEVQIEEIEQEIQVLKDQGITDEQNNNSNMQPGLDNRSRSKTNAELRQQEIDDAEEEQLMILRMHEIADEIRDVLMEKQKIDWKIDEMKVKIKEEKDHAKRVKLQKSQPHPDDQKDDLMEKKATLEEKHHDLESSLAYIIDEGRQWGVIEPNRDSQTERATIDDSLRDNYDQYGSDHSDGLSDKGRNGRSQNLRSLESSTVSQSESGVKSKKSKSKSKSKNRTKSRSGTKSQQKQSNFLESEDNDIMNNERVTNAKPKSRNVSTAILAPGSAENNNNNQLLQQYQNNNLQNNLNSELANSHQDNINFSKANVSQVMTVNIIKPEDSQQLQNSENTIITSDEISSKQVLLSPTNSNSIRLQSSLKDVKSKDSTLRYQDSQFDSDHDDTNSNDSDDNGDDDDDDPDNQNDQNNEDEQSKPDKTALAVKRLIRKMQKEELRLNRELDDVNEEFGEIQSYSAQKEAEWWELKDYDRNFDEIIDQILSEYPSLGDEDTNANVSHWQTQHCGGLDDSDGNTSIYTDLKVAAIEQETQQAYEELQAQMSSLGVPLGSLASTVTVGALASTATGMSSTLFSRSTNDVTGTTSEPASGITKGPGLLVSGRNQGAGGTGNIGKDLNNTIGNFVNDYVGGPGGPGHGPDNFSITKTMIDIESSQAAYLKQIKSQNDQLAEQFRRVYFAIIMHPIEILPDMVNKELEQQFKSTSTMKSQTTGVYDSSIHQQQRNTGSMMNLMKTMNSDNSYSSNGINNMTYRDSNTNQSQRRVSSVSRRSLLQQSQHSFNAQQLQLQLQNQMGLSKFEQEMHHFVKSENREQILDAMEQCLAEENYAKRQHDLEDYIKDTKQLHLDVLQVFEQLIRSIADQTGVQLIVSESVVFALSEVERRKNQSQSQNQSQNSSKGHSKDLIGEESHTQAGDDVINSTLGNSSHTTTGSTALSKQSQSRKNSNKNQFSVASGRSQQTQSSQQQQQYQPDPNAIATWIMRYIKNHGGGYVNSARSGIDSVNQGQGYNRNQITRPNNSVSIQSGESINSNGFSVSNSTVSRNYNSLVYNQDSQSQQSTSQMFNNSGAGPGTVGYISTGFVFGQEGGELLYELDSAELEEDLNNTIELWNKYYLRQIEKLRMEELVKRRDQLGNGPGNRSSSFNFQSKRASSSRMNNSSFMNRYYQQNDNSIPLTAGSPFGQVQQQRWSSQQQSQVNPDASDDPETQQEGTNAIWQVVEILKENLMSVVNTLRKQVGSDKDILTRISGVVIARGRQMDLRKGGAVKEFQSQMNMANKKNANNINQGAESGQQNSPNSNSEISNNSPNSSILSASGSGPGSNRTTNASMRISSVSGNIQSNFDPVQAIKAAISDESRNMEELENLLHDRIVVGSFETNAGFTGFSKAMLRDFILSKVERSAQQNFGGGGNNNNNNGTNNNNLNNRQQQQSTMAVTTDGLNRTLPSKLLSGKLALRQQFQTQSQQSIQSNRTGTLVNQQGPKWQQQFVTSGPQGEKIRSRQIPVPHIRVLMHSGQLNEREIQIVDRLTMEQIENAIINDPKLMFLFENYQKANQILVQKNTQVEILETEIYEAGNLLAEVTQKVDDITRELQQHYSKLFEKKHNEFHRTKPKTTNKHLHTVNGSVIPLHKLPHDVDYLSVGNVVSSPNQQTRQIVLPQPFTHRSAKLIDAQQAAKELKAQHKKQQNLMNMHKQQQHSNLNQSGTQQNQSLVQSTVQGAGVAQQSNLSPSKSNKVLNLKSSTSFRTRTDGDVYNSDSNNLNDENQDINLVTSLQQQESEPSYDRVGKVKVFETQTQSQKSQAQQDLGNIRKTQIRATSVTARAASGFNSLLPTKRTVIISSEEPQVNDLDRDTVRASAAQAMIVPQDTVDAVEFFDDDDDEEQQTSIDPDNDQELEQNQYSNQSEQQYYRDRTGTVGTVQQSQFQGESENLKQQQLRFTDILRCIDEGVVGLHGVDDLERAKTQQLDTFMEAFVQADSSANWDGEIPHLSQKKLEQATLENRKNKITPKIDVDKLFKRVKHLKHLRHARAFKVSGDISQTSRFKQHVHTQQQSDLQNKVGSSPNIIVNNNSNYGENLNGNNLNLGQQDQNQISHSSNTINMFKADGILPGSSLQDSGQQDPNKPTQSNYPPSNSVSLSKKSQKLKSQTGAISSSQTVFRQSMARSQPVQDMININDRGDESLGLWKSNTLSDKSRVDSGSSSDDDLKARQVEEDIQDEIRFLELEHADDYATSQVLKAVEKLEMVCSHLFDMSYEQQEGLIETHLARLAEQHLYLNLILSHTKVTRNSRDSYGPGVKKQLSESSKSQTQTQQQQQHLGDSDSLEEVTTVQTSESIVVQTDDGVIIDPGVRLALSPNGETMIAQAVTVQTEKQTQNQLENMILGNIDSDSNRVNASKKDQVFKPSQRTSSGNLDPNLSSRQTLQQSQPQTQIENQNEERSDSLVQKSKEQQKVLAQQSDDKVRNCANNLSIDELISTIISLLTYLQERASSQLQALLGSEDGYRMVLQLKSVQRVFEGSKLDAKRILEDGQKSNRNNNMEEKSKENDLDDNIRGSEGKILSQQNGQSGHAKSTQSDQAPKQTRQLVNHWFKQMHMPMEVHPDLLMRLVAHVNQRQGKIRQALTAVLLRIKSLIQYPQQYSNNTKDFKDLITTLESEIPIVDAKDVALGSEIIASIGREVVHEIQEHAQENQEIQHALIELEGTIKTLENELTHMKIMVNDNWLMK